MNGILLIDKPEGWTSHDVVAKLRGVMHERRAGHSGTLDPLATGLLTVFFGRATRAVEFAEADEKTYTAGVRFGISTDTQDVTGRVIAEKEPDFDRQRLESVLKHFRGEITQIPPMYSAVKVNGQKLYELARRGKEVARKPRAVTIFSLEAEGDCPREMTLRVRCSKGTYIRTLCSDIGDELGCGACMSTLRRTSAGFFSVEQAHTLDEVIALEAEGRAEQLLLPVDSLFSAFERIDFSEKQEKLVRNGMSFPYDRPDGSYRAYSPLGAFLALTEIKQGSARTIKSFYEVGI